jgi:hypothetical protein
MYYLFSGFVDTGNVPASTYIVIGAVAGVLVIASIVMSIFTKKKK